jgi:hypothetical protein
MHGTITQLTSDRGTGALVGTDDKTYALHRQVLKNCWFHELSVGAAVTFQVGKPLEAITVRLVR